MTAIERAGGKVAFDWQVGNSSFDPNGKPWCPKWLVDRVGIDYFGHVVAVNFFGTDRTRTCCMSPRLSQVEELSFYGSSATDAGLVHLEGLARLKFLSLSYMRITDAGVANLEGLTNLHGLAFEAHRHH